MTKRAANGLTRRALLSGIAAVAGQAAFAEGLTRSVRPTMRPTGIAPNRAPEAEALVARARLGGQVSFTVANARTGQILESFNPMMGLPPASVAKAVTAQYALETLGPAHAFTTRILATAPLMDGKIDGDIILVGGGDPMLDTNALAELAMALKSTGLSEVKGRFFVSPGDLPHIDQIDPDQPQHLGYNPAISGLNLNYNRVHFEWKRASNAYTVTMDARSEKYRPEVDVARMKITNEAGPTYTYTSGGNVENWTVARRALGSGGSRWLPVRQPELYAGEVFQIFARSNGIVLKDAEVLQGPARGIRLVERKSPPLQAILRGMLKYSTNLTAEVSGLGASVARGKSITALEDSGAEMSRWARGRLGMKRAQFVDHSGLGDGTRISSADLVEGMLRIGPDSTLATIMKDIPPRDDNGNVRANTDVSVRAKTGTLNFVSGLSGFISAGANSRLAFAILAADLPRRDALPIEQRERPPGAKGWNSQAKRLQYQLINRWSDLYRT